MIVIAMVRLSGSLGAWIVIGFAISLLRVL